MRCQSYGIAVTLQLKPKWHVYISVLRFKDCVSACGVYASLLLFQVCLALGLPVVLCSGKFSSDDCTVCYTMCASFLCISCACPLQVQFIQQVY
jgi:hypothetical protein